MQPSQGLASIIADAGVRWLWEDGVMIAEPVAISQTLHANYFHSPSLFHVE
jgi:hypothetical protein